MRAAPPRLASKQTTDYTAAHVHHAGSDYDMIYSHSHGHGHSMRDSISTCELFHVCV
jgi:hypothetical protein